MSTRKTNPKKFARSVLPITIVCCMGMGYYYVGYGRILGPFIGEYNETVSANIHIDDTEFYRIEGLGEINNVNMLWNMSSLKSFTSIIPSSTFELYEMLGIERSVNSDPDKDCYGLRCYTNVKYLIVEDDYDDTKLSNALKEYEVFEYYGSQNGYDIYINKYALPMGFAYDEYITYEQMESCSASYRDKLLCRAVTLTDEQIERYQSLLTPLDEDKIGKITLEEFKSDAQSRISQGITFFRTNNSGFSAKTNYDSPELVVFSVPYDSGWSATVNGEPVLIEKVNGGFCAIEVSAGMCNIEFTYTTPGGKLGIICTISGIVLLGIYLAFFYLIKKHKPKSYVHLMELELVDGVKAHKAYINQLSEKIYNCPEKGEVKFDDSLQLFNVEEDFMDRKIYDFDKAEPLIVKGHITEHDEAYHILKELEEKNKGEIE